MREPAWGVSFLLRTLLPAPYPSYLLGKYIVIKHLHLFPLPGTSNRESRIPDLIPKEW